MGRARRDDLGARDDRLVFLLFLAGLEVEFDKLRGRLLGVAGGGWLLSFGIAVVAGLALKAGGLAQTPLLVAVILSATSLGVIIPVLKDAGEIASPFGQLVVAAGSIADFGAIILLSPRVPPHLEAIGFGVFIPVCAAATVACEFLGGRKGRTPEPTGTIALSAPSPRPDGAALSAIGSE